MMLPSAPNPSSLQTVLGHACVHFMSPQVHPFYSAQQPWADRWVLPISWS